MSESTPHEYKLIFTGDGRGLARTHAAGENEIPPVQTEVQNTDRSTHAKVSTTAALDYGEVTLQDGNKLRLYGTPGQARFDFMWKILANGALGVVILVDNGRPDPVADMRLYLQAFSEAVSGSRAVIGIGRGEEHPTPTTETFYTAMHELGFSAPILSVDVRRREDVLLLLDILFNQIEAADPPQ